VEGFALISGRALGATLFALALAGLTGCEPASVTPGGMASAAAANAPPGAGAAPRSEGAVSLADGGPRPSVQELTPDDDVRNAGRRIDALERALKARDQRVRELEGALAASVEEGAASLAAERTARAEALRALDAKVGALTAELARLSTDADARAQALARAEKTIAALKDASPLSNISAEVPKIEGRVLSIERPSGAPPVVLLDVGRRQGVEATFEFTVVRDGRPFAKIALDRVEGELSSGRVVYAKDGEAVRPGDRATTRP